jgi:hypothetical protein
MKYLCSIREIGHKYGIIKIIPPSKKWLNGTFLISFSRLISGKSFDKIIDYNDYLFPTKIQNIHQLQHRNGPYAKFMVDLTEFLEQKRQPIKSHPMLDGHEVDLFHLYKAVTSRGGYHKVNNLKLWKEVSQDLRISSSNTGASTTLKQYYIRFLLSYEDFQASQGVVLPEYIYDYTPSAGSEMKSCDSNEDEMELSDEFEEDEEEDETFGYYDGKMFTLHQYKVISVWALPLIYVENGG